MPHITVQEWIGRCFNIMLDIVDESKYSDEEEGRVRCFNIKNDGRVYDGKEPIPMRRNKTGLIPEADIYYINGLCSFIDLNREPLFHYQCCGWLNICVFCMNCQTISCVNCFDCGCENYVIGEREYRYFAIKRTVDSSISLFFSEVLEEEVLEEEDAETLYSDED